MTPLAVLAELAGEDFGVSRELFETILRGMSEQDARSWTHSDLEDHLQEKGQELLRQLAQDFLDRRAREEPRLEGVEDSEGLVHGSVEEGRERTLSTRFGDVTVSRKAYRHRGASNLYPADAELNLPVEQYSHTLRKLAAIEASRDSYDEGVAAIERQTGQKLGKRQVEELAIRSSVDFDAFYALTSRQPCGADDVLVLTFDGKGVVMRPEGLREPTRQAAERSERRLKTRLSKGEKGNRKRMAEVACVYDLQPVPRAPADILRGSERAEATAAPKARAKWVRASVVLDAARVVARAYDEAERRDPGHRRTWVCLVDGNNHQIELVRRESIARGIRVTMVLDFVHVAEYVWKAAWGFFAEGNTAAEDWVRDRLQGILEGRAARVAAGMRASATKKGLSQTEREGVDRCADYLVNKSRFLDYPAALSAGWPISTGVIEGTCRHLVKDRMDITGARWGLEGAEAVLKLRALRTNGDFDRYWRFHLSQERRRNHQVRYSGNSIPGADHVT